MSSSGEAKILGLCAEIHDTNLRLKIGYKAIPFDPESDMLEDDCANEMLSSSVNIAWHGTSRHYAPNETIVREMVKSFDMKHLETIDLREFTEEEGLSKAIFDTLVDSTTLRCLLISRENMEAFFSCVTAAKSLAFPALRDLGVYDLSGNFFWPLVSALEARPEKLERLIIHQNSLSKSKFKRLQAIADVIFSAWTCRIMSISDCDMK
ncbi:hypothetical protein VNI00_005938 [Paramarasmius palmivorus]|uniref:Uncharacterized protein n=1 Tax=Paramarasmius palmivorus TaxID=297713 RepID=A0AAW0DDD7_9AGAR